MTATDRIYTGRGYSDSNAPDLSLCRPDSPYYNPDRFGLEHLVDINLVDKSDFDHYDEDGFRFNHYNIIAVMKIKGEQKYSLLFSKGSQDLIDHGFLYFGMDTEFDLTEPMDAADTKALITMDVAHMEGYNRWAAKSIAHAFNLIK
jgi:hypothetical protein